MLCSVKNDRQVSLSWFRANQLLSQTSSPDVNTTLSLRLDIDEKDNTVYSCVSANPVSNDTTYLNITAMCMNQKGLSTLPEFYHPKVKIVILSISGVNGTFDWIVYNANLNKCLYIMK